jgi:hypothetical protein
MLLIYGVLLNVGGMLLIFSGAFWYCSDSGAVVDALAFFQSRGNRDDR